MFAKRTIPSITPQQLRERQEGDVLDVREPDEWRAGHIDGSTHIPMGELSLRLGEVSGDRPVAVVCRSGQRSAQVTAALVRHGYDAANLDGGLQAWTRSGLPLVAEDGGAGRVV